MFVIYNETKTPWVRTAGKGNSKFDSLTATCTTKNNIDRYHRVTVGQDIATEDISKYVAMDKCVVLDTQNTSVKWKNKDFKPFTVPSSKQYNNDVMLIGIDMNGKFIKSIDENKVKVLSYMIANGCLFLNVMPFVKADEPVKFEIVLHDPKNVADISYVFEKVDGEYTVDIPMTQAEEVDDKHYRIKNYRPNRPTHAIFVARSNVQVLNKVLKWPDNHKIIEYTDEKSLTDAVADLKNEHYSVVTLFANSRKFEGENDKNFADEYNVLIKEFKLVNVMLNNGVTVRA